MHGPALAHTHSSALAPTLALLSTHWHLHHHQRLHHSSALALPLASVPALALERVRVQHLRLALDLEPITRIPNHPFGSA